MEILLVSPLPPLSIVFSKTVPYFILSLIILSIILILGVQLLQVPINGSLFLLFGVSMIFILAGLALGLLISSIAKTQQVAMLISLVGLMLPTMLLSGFMFPIESMPIALQIFSNIVPAKWYFYSLQSIMIKGLGIGSILKEIAVLSFFAIFFLAVSIRKFKIRLS
jgi:ABC-2 type transport system permease protein